MSSTHTHPKEKTKYPLKFKKKYATKLEITPLIMNVSAIAIRPSFSFFDKISNSIAPIIANCKSTAKCHVGR